MLLDRRDHDIFDKVNSPKRRGNEMQPIYTAASYVRVWIRPRGREAYVLERTL